MREIQVQKLTKDNFGKYGEFLDLLDESELKKKSIFQEGFFADVVALEFNQGNQPTISVCHVKKQSENIISFLEAHQYACEGLLPLDGDVIIFVGIMDSDFRTESIEAFYVPKGTFVKLNPLIVHGTQYPVDKEDVHIVCMLPGGTSEKIVGEVLKEIPREQVLISTKFGLIPDIYTHGYKKDTSYKNAMREIQSSLMNLETDYIDFYFVHWPDVNTPIDETMAALEEMKRKGYIRYVGVSNFTAEQIKEAEQYIQIDVQQPLYSMVDRGFEDLMSWGYDRGIDSMTYGSMGAGILSGKIRSVPSFEKNDLRLNFYDVYKEPKFSKIMELLKVMDSIADGHNVPVGQVALNWSTQKEYVGTALVGVRSIEHADENCKTFDWKLTEEEMKILDSKIEECAL